MIDHAVYIVLDNGPLLGGLCNYLDYCLTHIFLYTFWNKQISFDCCVLREQSVSRGDLSRAMDHLGDIQMTSMSHSQSFSRQQTDPDITERDKPSSTQ